MAFDKVVDSAFLEAGLKKVGDSIRAKAGTSELFEFPDAMSAAVDAIDTSENLDDALNDQESLIDQIQAALEGKATGGATVETCTITFVEESDIIGSEWVDCTVKYVNIVDDYIQWCEDYISTPNMTITVLKNSFVWVSGHNLYADSNLEIVVDHSSQSGSSYMIYFVTADCQMTLSTDGGMPQ